MSNQLLAMELGGAVIEQVYYGSYVQRAGTRSSVIGTKKFIYPKFLRYRDLSKARAITTTIRK
jgi:hypothetical protein